MPHVIILVTENHYEFNTKQNELVNIFKHKICLNQNSQLTVHNKDHMFTAPNIQDKLHVCILIFKRYHILVNLS